MKQRDEYTVDIKVHNPRGVNLVCDATFYEKRKDKLGTSVFKDVESKEILIWKHIESEVVKDYKYLKEELIELGYTIKSATLDGKSGLYKAFKGIPIPNVPLPSKENYTTIYYDATKTRSQQRP